MQSDPMLIQMLETIKRDIQEVKEQVLSINGRARDGEQKLAVLTSRFNDCRTQHFVQKQVTPPGRFPERLKDNAGLAGMALAGLVLALQIIQLLLRAGG